MNKKHPRKRLAWIAFSSMIVICSAITIPLTIIYSNKGDEPIVDPTDLDAFLMIEDVNFRSPKDSNPMITNVVIPTDEKSIKFEGLFTKGQIGTHFSNVDFSGLDYIQFGREFGNTASFSSSSGFSFNPANLKDKDIKTIVFNDMRSVFVGRSTSINFGGNSTADGMLNGNHTFFFDLDVNLISTVNYEGGFVKPFTVDPEAIYIRDGNGTVEQWMEKLNVTDKSIFKIVK